MAGKMSSLNILYLLFFYIHFEEACLIGIAWLTYTQTIFKDGQSKQIFLRIWFWDPKLGLHWQHDGDQQLHQTNHRREVETGGDLEQGSAQQ